MQAALASSTVSTSLPFRCFCRWSIDREYDGSCVLLCSSSGENWHYRIIKHSSGIDLSYQFLSADTFIIERRAALHRIDAIRATHACQIISAMIISSREEWLPSRLIGSEQVRFRKRMLPARSLTADSECTVPPKWFLSSVRECECTSNHSLASTSDDESADDLLVNTHNDSSGFFSLERDYSASPRTRSLPAIHMGTFNY